MLQVCRTVHKYDEQTCQSLVRANYTANMTDIENVVSQDTSMWMFYQTIVFTVPSTVVTLLMGLYGDKFGLRLPLITPLLGQALGKLLLRFAQQSIFVAGVQTTC